eukprot:scaffold10053_cov52-Phaeocystis_antarctica.AAC.3
MSMLRSNTAVSVTYKNVTPQAATGDRVELRAQSKKSFPVRAPSRSRSSVEPMSAPPRSSAHPAMSEDCGSSSTVQLAAKATSKKSSSTRK